MPELLAPCVGDEVADGDGVEHWDAVAVGDGDPVADLVEVADAVPLPEGESVVVRLPVEVLLLL